MMPLALRMATVTAHRDRPLNGLASPPTSTALGSLVRSGSLWPLSGNCTEKQLPTDTPRPTASFDPCHRPLVPRRACVEPRPLVQTGPQGDSLLACGTRRRRRPSRLERARRREAHWTVVASPLPEKSQEPSFSAAGSKYVADRFVPIAAHFLATAAGSKYVACTSGAVSSIVV